MRQTLARLGLIAAFLVIWVSSSGAQRASNAPPISAPGQLVDIGGWRVHLNCTGQASASQPTVILEAGAGGFSVDWSLVQPEAARLARVCSYDRSGLGWSDLGPRPRTMRQTVWELHTLLEKAGVRPPYVLVGHSHGGTLARLYAFTYPSEVVGMVLVESGNEKGGVVFRNGKTVRLIETATGRPIPPIKTSEPLHETELTGNIRSQIEAAAREMAPHATEPPYNKLPADAQRMRAWSFSQLKHWATNDNPFEGEELVALLKKRTEEKHLLGDMPLIVLSRGQEIDDEHSRNQAELVSLSRRGRQVIARRSGHEIMITEPDLVVTAIRDTLGATRR